MQIHHDNATRDESRVAETAVQFDMSSIDAIDGTVTRAIIRYDEKPQRWTSGSGAEQYKVGCVASIGIATVDWANQSLNALTPNDLYHTSKDGHDTNWSVLQQVKDQLASPGDASLRYGYVFQGGMSLNNLEGDDSTSCYSTISNIRLEITMDVQEAAPPPPAPPPPPPPPPPPSKPDLSVTRVSGPSTLADGTTGVYELVLWNDGTPAQGTAQIQIEAIGPITLDSMVQLPAGFTCDTNDFGVACVGSLGGFDDPMLSRGATFKMQVRGNGTGKGTVVGSANHDRALDEITIDNNLKTLEITVS
jgi:hypothetical protein